MTESNKGPVSILAKFCCPKGASRGPTRSSARVAGVPATFPEGLESDKKKLALAVEQDVKGPYDKQSRADHFKREAKVARYVLDRLDADLNVAPKLCGKAFDRHIYNMCREGLYPPPNRNIPWETAFFHVDDVSKWDTAAKRLQEVKRVYNDLKAHCTAIVTNKPCTCSTWNHQDDFLYEGRESGRQSLEEWLDLDLYDSVPDDEVLFDDDGDEPM
jgi:hypothetical protein